MTVSTRWVSCCKGTIRHFVKLTFLLVMTMTIQVIATAMMMMLIGEDYDD